MNKLLNIIIGISKKGTGAKDAEKELTGVEKATKLAGKALIGFATIQTVRAAYELAELGAQSLRTKAAFVAISGGAYKAEIRLDAMKKATRGALSEQQMMASANRLMQMGLANNAEELGNLTHMATRLGAAMGKEAGPAIEEFALMLANQSIPRLDTFGISAGRTRTRILALMKANEGMTRETAFMTAVMEEGELAMGRLGEGTEDAALSFERMKATAADLKIEVGERLTPVFSRAADAALLLLTWNEKLDATMAEHEETVRVTAASYDEYAREMLRAQGIEGEHYIALMSSYAAFEELGPAIDQAAKDYGFLSEELWNASQLTDGWSVAMSGAASAAGDAGAAIEDAGQAAGEAAGLFGGLLDNVASLGGKFASFDVGLDKSWGLLMKTGRATGMSVEEMGKLATSVGIADESQVKATVTQHRLVEAWNSGVISSKQAVVMVGEMNEANIELELSTTAMEDGQTKLAEAHQANADALVDGIANTLDYFTALEEARGEVETTSNSTQDLEGNTDLYSTALERARGEVKMTLSPMQDLATNTNRLGTAFASAETRARQLRAELFRLHSMIVATAPATPSPPPHLPEGAGLGMSSGFGMGGGPSRSYTDGRSYQGGNTTVIIQDPLAAALVMEQISGELADEIAGM